MVHTSRPNKRPSRHTIGGPPATRPGAALCKNRAPPAESGSPEGVVRNGVMHEMVAQHGCWPAIVLKIPIHEFLRTILFI